MKQLATIVVCPRERFRPLPRSLKSLFATIDRDVPVTVIEGGCPPHIREQLYALRENRLFDLVESQEFVLPSQARNQGLEKVATKYVVFCDNDVEYSPGWLEAMIRNAEENGSAAVSPVTMIGPSDPPLIHHAGGVFKMIESSKGRWLQDRHLLEHMPLQEAEAKDFAGTVLDHAHVEFHCALFDAQALRGLGGFDERLVILEHMDTSLRLLLEDRRITFEKDARVMYLAYEPFEAEDWPYFLFRWSQIHADETDLLLDKTWGISPPPGPLGKFVRVHTARAARATIPPLPKFLNRNKVRKALGKMVLSFYRRKYPQVPDMRAARVLTAPPSDALDRVSGKLSGAGRAGAGPSMGP